MQVKPQGGLSDYSDVPAVSSPLGTFVSVYAGAGGMDLGFALAGFAPVWANDFDANAMATHQRVFERLADERPHLASRTWSEVTGSILDLPPHDLVIGGPPCQGFSVAGKMDPTDHRSEHVFHFFEVVEHIAPTAFVMENVKALYENRRWAPIRTALLERAHQLGYETRLMCLDASHFGVPQARERMFLIGIRGKTPLEPTPTTLECRPTVRQALIQLPGIGELGNHNLCTAKITPARSPVMRKSPFAGMLFNGAGRPLDLDAPSLTLAASMGGNKTPIIDQESLQSGSTPWVVGYHKRLVNGGKPVKMIPKRLRRLSVQEAAALQSFPTGMEWAGTQSSQYRQIGNAVPPRLALAVADAVKATLGLS